MALVGGLLSLHAYLDATRAFLSGWPVASCYMILSE